MALDRFNEVLSYINLLQLVAGSGVTPQTSVINSTPPLRIDSIILTSTAAIAHDVALYAHLGSGNYIIAVISVPALSGSSAVPPVDLISALPGAPGGIVVTPTVGLYLGCLVTLSGAETINAVAIGGFL